VSKLPVIDKYAARLLMVSFFLPMQLQVWATMATGSYFVLRTFLTRQPVPKVNYAWALLLGSLFLMYLVAVPLTDPAYRRVVLSLCEHRVSLLFLPFAFAIVAPVFRQVIMDELLFFVYGCFVTCVAANADFAYHYFSKGGIANLTHVQYRTIIHLFTDIHPTYLSMYLCFSICILLFSDVSGSRVGSIIKYVLVNTMLILLLALLAKTPLIALFVIFVHYLYLQRRSLYKFKWFFVGLLLSVTAAWFFIPFFSQRVKETLPFFGVGKTTNVVENSVAARQLIWDVDTRMVKEHWLTGVGPGKMMLVLNEQYRSYSANSILPVMYDDPHNEYFMEWLSFGVFGFVLLVVVLAVQFFRAVQTRNYLYLYLLIILSTTFFTETVLSLQRGVMLYAVFGALMFYPKPLKWLRLSANS
jgi:O-antigen ligase